MKRVTLDEIDEVECRIKSAFSICKLSKGESLDSDMNVQEPVNVIYQTIISVKSLCFSSIVISTDALAYIILEHEEKNTMTFLSD